MFILSNSILLKLRPKDSEDIIKIKLKKMINISVKLNKSKYKVVKKVIVKQEIKMYLISLKIFKSLLSPQLNFGERIMKNKKNSPTIIKKVEIIFLAIKSLKNELFFVVKFCDSVLRFFKASYEKEVF